MFHLPDPFLSARFNNIKATVLSPVSKLGLAEYINKFGNLVFGPLKQEVFNQNFNNLKRRHLFSLINPFYNELQKQDLQFYLYMMHESQKINSWQWPGVATQIDGNVEWTSGGSRLFATGMTKQNPCNILNYLILQHHSTPLNAYIQDPVLVKDDAMLHKVLNVNQDDEPWLPHCEIMLNYDINDYKETLSLASIKDPYYFTDHATAGEKFLEDFLLWRQKYGERPILQVYTNWPELIKNSHRVWDIRIAGNVDEIKRNIHYPAHLEGQVKRLHDFHKPQDNIHTLTIVEPRPIDVAELLFWVNLEKTAFISSDWSFLLYRPDTEYTNTFIDLSYVDN